MELKERTPESNKTEFAVFALEATAKKMGIPTSEVLRRLDCVGLIDSFILGCYDTLHTQSVESVATDVTEALLNWETKQSKKKGEDQ